MGNIISYTKEIPFVKRFFGFSFALLALIMLVTTGSLFTLILLAIGLGLNSSERADLNLTDKTIRNFKTLFGIKFGKWESMPNFEYVSVFKTKENQTIRVVSAETTQTSDVILVNLFYERNKHITLFKTDNKNEAFKVAKHINEAIDIPVLDATEKEKIWL